ncbi:MAG: chaperone modulator CbpM, partial [Deltaproteobacteria bacterium]
LRELAERCGVELTFVEQLVDHGIIESHADDAEQFPGEVTLRVHRCLRLQRDLGVNFEGAAVILQLLEQIESLEHELLGLRRR